MNETEIIPGRGMRERENTHSQLAVSYLNKVYAWMAVTMLITTGVAVLSTHDETLKNLAFQHPCIIAVLSVVVVLVMSFGRNALGASALSGLLVLFSALEGLLFGPILTLYTQESLATTFACTAGTFGAMSLYGYFTKRNLSSWGRLLFMVLIGLLICLIVNFFIGSGTFDLVISAIGVVLFSALTAYDTQTLLREGLALDGESRRRAAVLGALNLYLDFINLFLYLLRFLGDRK